MDFDKMTETSIVFKTTSKEEKEILERAYDIVDSIFQEISPLIKTDGFYVEGIAEIIEKQEFTATLEILNMLRTDSFKFTLSDEEYLTIV